MDGIERTLIITTITSFVVLIGAMTWLVVLPI
jgi:hypothetical protein